MEEIVFLGLTIAVELPIALVIMKFKQWQRVALAVLFVNMFTHPIAWFLAMDGFEIFTIEVGVVLTEMLVFALLFVSARTRMLLAAFLMNTVSALIGVAFF
jgi:hypothetical protein